MDVLTYFLNVCHESTRGNRHKLKYKKVQLKRTNKIFAVRMTEHCNELPRLIVESHL